MASDREMQSSKSWPRSRIKKLRSVRGFSTSATTTLTAGQTVDEDRTQVETLCCGHVVSGYEDETRLNAVGLALGEVDVRVEDELDFVVEDVFPARHQLAASRVGSHRSMA